MADIPRSPAAPADPPGGTAALLVCVYYRVATVHIAQANALVREFQRDLARLWPELHPEVLLRCELPTPPDPAEARATPADAIDPTLMETYRLRLPASPGSAAADAIVRDFLRALDAAASPLAGLLRGARHLELFHPCVS